MLTHVSVRGSAPNPGSSLGGPFARAAPRGPAVRATGGGRRPQLGRERRPLKRSEPSPDVFRALADPTRRAILQMLRKGALNSGEIADRFDASWPTISRHLAVLHAAGLVVSVRHKQEIRYELNTSVVQELA